MWKKNKEKSIKEMIKEEDNEWWRIKRVKEYKNKKKKKYKSNNCDGCKVIKIPIRILKSYDFTIQHYENDSNLNWILKVIES